MGLGLFGGGAGAARYFAGLGAEVTVTDMADAKKLARSVAALNGLGIHFVLGEHREEDFTEADLVVANQAVRPDNRLLLAAREAGTPVATETGLALALNRSPWLGVTGSSGKSTTTALLAAMLRRRFPDAMMGGNIGGDLLTRVEGRDEDAPLAVELSSFQLTWMADDLASGRIPPPRVAVVTNLSPNHLDWHRDMDEYVEAKRNLIRFQTRADWTVLNVDDPVLRQWAKRAPGRVIRCGYDNPGGDDACHVDDGCIALRLGGLEEARVPLTALRLLGRHNVYNAVEAVAAAYVVTGDDTIGEALVDFSGLEHRLERAAAAGGKTFVNDSKSTTPESAITALRAMDGPVVLIAGGYDKKSPFEELGQAIQERASGLVLLGEAGPRLRAAVEAAADRRPETAEPLALEDGGDDFDQAVETAWRMTPGGGTVLLSPACASWGMFTNYEERGARFKAIAERLGGQC